MAIAWSAPSGNLRVGIEAVQSPSTIQASTSYVTLTVNYYVESVRYGFNDNQTLNMFGEISGSVAYSMTSGPNQTVARHVASRSIQVTPSYGSSKVVSFGASVSGMFNGGNPVATYDYRLAARPWQRPRPPLNPTAVRNSDSQATVSWGQDFTSSMEGYPWSNLAISRTEGSLTAWRDVAILGWNPTSWVDRSIQPNNRYQYGIRSNNPSGDSSRVYTQTIYTTPAPPSNVRAVKVGNDIQLTWVNNAPYATSFEILEGGARVGTTTGTSYTVPAPPVAVAHTYQVAALVSGLSSARAWSNTVQLQAAPLAPTNLGPRETANRTYGVPLSWEHNPVDTTSQTAYDLRWRYRGESMWQTQTGKVASTFQGFTIPSDQLTKDGTIEWQVRTWGAHADGSPYSNVSSFYVTRPPSATITSPTANQVIDSSRIRLAWTYHHPSSSPQYGWRIKVVGSDSITSTHTGTGSNRSVLLGRHFKNGETVQITLELREANGLWSPPVSVQARIVYATPPEPQVLVTWQPATGAHEIQIINPPGAPSAVNNRVERNVGNSWEVVAQGVSPSSTLLDYEGLVGGTTTYRVIAVSDLPSESSSTVQVTVPESGEASVWINGGPGFAQGVRFAWNPAIQVSVNRSRELYYFDGQALPVEITGTEISRVVNINASALHQDPNHTPGRLDQISVLPGPHLYRDPGGRRIYGSLSGASWGHSPSLVDTIAVTLTETQYQPGA